MKNFNICITIILTFFDTLPIISGDDQVDKDDLEELRKMLKALQTVPRLFSREVLTDGDQKVSIDKYYENSIDLNPDVYILLFHILNNALSCEYGEITYYFIIISEVSMNECITDLEKCRSRTTRKKSKHLVSIGSNAYYNCASLRSILYNSVYLTKNNIVTITSVHLLVYDLWRAHDKTFSEVTPLYPPSTRTSKPIIQTVNHGHTESCELVLRILFSYLRIFSFFYLKKKIQLTYGRYIIIS